MTDHIYDDLKRDEGFEEEAYRDSVGKLTIGYGWNIDDRPISKAAAEFILREQVAEATTELIQNFNWFGDLSPNRKRALQNMCFNLGIVRLKGFRNMLDAMEKGEWSRAAAEALDSKWARQVGIRATRIAEMIQRG